MEAVRAGPMSIRSAYIRDMRTAGLVACMAVGLVGCSDGSPQDRSAEVKTACEDALRSRPGMTDARLADDVRVDRFGSGGWTVEGAIAGGGSVRCGVIADGDADEAPLRVDGLDIK